MRYKLSDFFDLLHPQDRLALLEIYNRGRLRSLRSRYQNKKIRDAYTLFTGTLILKEAYYFIYEKLSQILQKKDSVRIIDLGIGEGSMWKRIFNFSRDLFQNRRIEITGIDYSKVALKRIDENLSDLPFCSILPIRLNLKNIDNIGLSIRPDLIVSSLALHHLRLRDKLKVLKKITSLRSDYIIIVEVDYNLEKIDNLFVRNLSTTLLYRDVFETIRAFNSKRIATEILNNFYYEEYLNILKATRLGLEERYITLSDWAELFQSLGMKIDEIKNTFCGINNIYKIGIISIRNESFTKKNHQKY